MTRIFFPLHLLASHGNLITFLKGWARPEPAVPKAGTTLEPDATLVPGDRYRKEIDGLRAIALLPVILFHAGLERFSGGFVGVDVFFVISGYLITSIILSEQQAGTFTLIRFYERRARRILPALFVVMLACIPFAWLWMFPSDWEHFAKSLVAVSLFVSNISFWSESGYFDQAAQLKPLLHTWSLAVEEQYYVLFPLFLLLARRWGARRMVASLVILATLSFTVAQLGSVYKPRAAFYLLPPRGWEFLIGSFIAFYELSKKNSRKAGPARSQLLSLVGLVLIASAVFVFSQRTPFPSIYALVPTVGAALIIMFAHPYTFVGRVLSSKPLAGIGLISYSAYLWHYPLFAFAWLRSVKPPSAVLLVCLAACALLLGYLSWKWIEQPFRDKRQFSRTQIFALAASLSIFLIVIGLVGYHKDPPQSSYQDLDYRIRVNFGLSQACDGRFTSEDCRTSEVPEILVWGDSLAMTLVPGLLASNPEARLIQMTRSGCGPIYGLAVFNQTLRLPEEWAGPCLEFNSQVMAWLEHNTSVKYAVLTSPFNQYLAEDSSFLTAEGEIASNQLDALGYFLQTLNRLSQKGIKPVIFAPPPRSLDDVGQCLIRSIRFQSDQAQCDFSWPDAAKRQESVTRFLLEVSKRYQVVWLADKICNDTSCRAMLDGKLLYRHKIHLSYEGVAALGKKMDFYKLVTDSPQIQDGPNRALGMGLE